MEKGEGKTESTQERRTWEQRNKETKRNDMTTNHRGRKLRKPENNNGRREGMTGNKSGKGGAK